MARLILFNKPFNVLSQFTDTNNRATLATYIQTENVYAAGRLDYDSEGLLLLTDSGPLQHRIADPKHKLPKTYWVQVEGQPSSAAIHSLESGLELKDGMTAPAEAKLIDEPAVWSRTPPIRQRNNDVTSWLSLTITEGKNRQVRRMTAAIGHPTLRLIRYSIGDWTIDNLHSGTSTELTVDMPVQSKKNTQNKKRSHHPRRSR